MLVQMSWPPPVLHLAKDIPFMKQKDHRHKTDEKADVNAYHGLLN